MRDGGNCQRSNTHDQLLLWLFGITASARRRARARSLSLVLMPDPTLLSLPPQPPRLWQRWKLDGTSMGGGRLVVVRRHCIASSIRTQQVSLPVRASTGVEYDGTPRRHSTQADLQGGAPRKGRSTRGAPPTGRSTGGSFF